MRTEHFHKCKDTLNNCNNNNANNRMENVDEFNYTLCVCVQMDAFVLNMWPEVYGFCFDMESNNQKHNNIAFPFCIWILQYRNIERCLRKRQTENQGNLHQQANEINKIFWLIYWTLQITWYAFEGFAYVFYDKDIVFNTTNLALLHSIINDFHANYIGPLFCKWF